MIRSQQKLSFSSSGISRWFNYRENVISKQHTYSQWLLQPFRRAGRGTYKIRMQDKSKAVQHQLLPPMRLRTELCPKARSCTKFQGVPGLVASRALLPKTSFSEAQLT